MLSRKIVADSSADTLYLDGVDFASASLTIVTDDKEYVDNATLNVVQMTENLLKYNGKSSTIYR
jgi:predicted RNA-binding protein with EMAP domain